MYLVTVSNCFMQYVRKNVQKYLILVQTGNVNSQRKNKILFFCTHLEFQVSLALIAGFRAGLAGMDLGYPENPLLKPRKQCKAVFINMLCGFKLG